MAVGRPKAKLVAEREALERLVRRRTTAQALASRAQIVLCCASGETNLAVARELNMTPADSRPLPVCSILA